MNYEVFLVARVRESLRAGRSDNEALAEGLARCHSYKLRPAQKSRPFRVI